MLDFKDIAKIFEKIELSLIRSLKRNLGRHKQEEQQEGFEWSAWQAEKLRNINKFRRECSDIMSEYTDVIDSETRQLMEEQFKEGVNGITVPQSEMISDIPQVTLNPEPEFFGVDDTKVTKLIDDVVNLEKHAETATLRTMDDIYRQTVHKAQLAMSTGGMTLQQAIDMSVKDFLNKGINCIVYRDGRHVNIADYVRMALRTTSTRAKLQGESERFRTMGYDTVRVTQYSMCSKTCLPWQGRPYINDVFVLWDGEIEERENGELWGKSNYCGKWFPLLSTAIHAGLFHPNCRHTIVLYKDGDSLPEPMDNSEIEKRYKLEQKQRRLENEVRKARRKAEGFSDPDNVKKAKKEVREAQKKLRDFIDQTNAAYGKIILKRDYDREKIYYGEINSPVPSETPVSVLAAPEVKSVEVIVKAPETAQGAYRDEVISIPKAERHNSDDVMESRFTENLDDLNNGQRDVIKHRNIELELEKSDIGKEYKQYLVDNPCRINIYYNVDVEKEHLGEYDSFTDTINIFGSNTKTIAKTSEVLIHELTHRRYNIYGDFWSECVCRAHEIMHRKQRNYLTIAEKRAIIKEIREVYGEIHPDWKWRRKL